MRSDCEKHLKTPITLPACTKNNCSIERIGLFTKRKQQTILELHVDVNSTDGLLFSDDITRLVVRVSEVTRFIFFVLFSPKYIYITSIRLSNPFVFEHTL